MHRRGLSDILHIEVLDGRREAAHSHQDVELLYILEGLLYVTEGEKKSCLEEGDIYIINPNRLHELYTKEEVLFVKISIFYQQAADTFFQRNSLFLCHSDQDTGRLKQTVKRLLEYYVKKEKNGTDFGYLAVCCELLDVLEKDYMTKQTSLPVADEEKFQRRIRQINEYVWNNYQMPINMKELSESLYLSNGYLSRFFKENYGMSFSEYLTSVRLHYATEDLVYTSHPITQVAYDNGFPSAVAFNRVFKKSYQQTPTEYRGKYGQASADGRKGQSRAEAKKKLEQHLSKEWEKAAILEEAAYTVREETGTYRAGRYTDTQFLWNQAISIGAAEDLLRVDICEHIALLKGALKFKYVRFWNLFSRELLLDAPDENGEYNFSKIDYITDFLLKEDLIPHIEFGVKVKRLQKNADISIIYAEDHDVSQEPEKWRLRLDSLVRHWVERYGTAEIDKWRLEISYNAELKNYGGFFAVLNETYHVVRKYSGKMEIGAGEIKAGYVKQIQSGFWREWGKQAQKPDFISIMHYAYKTCEENGRYFFRPNADTNISEEIEHAKSYLRIAGMEGQKVYVTECGFSVSDRNFINDSCFAGAYYIKAVLSTYGKVDMLGYCLGSDRTSQHYDSKTILFGGRGLVTKDGILKPSGFAVEFLNRLYPYKIGHSGSYILTTDGRDNYALVCHNQKKLNYHYYLTDEEMIQKESPEKYFDDMGGLRIKIFLTGIPDGKYKIKIYSVNEKYGNILGNWEKMNYDRDISRTDIQYLRRINEPILSVNVRETRNNTLEVSHLLSANEIAYLHISPAK